ncbi:hypothetical protein HY045_00960 [Candidatus Woesebacteria bacterium]|nr:hypothetical protein [Candidatus Woesebacteria bacterium]
MPIFPEREPQSQITEIPQVPEIPPAIEKAGVTAVPNQVSNPVKSDNGQVLTQTPAASTISIQLSQPQQNLLVWSKGEVGSSLTWWSVFWIRMVKKAIHFGWKIVTRSSQ